MDELHNELRFLVEYWVADPAERDGTAQAITDELDRVACVLEEVRAEAEVLEDNYGPGWRQPRRGPYMDDESYEAFVSSR